MKIVIVGVCLRQLSIQLLNNDCQLTEATICPPPDVFLSMGIYFPLWICVVALFVFNPSYWYLGTKLHEILIGCQRATMNQSNSVP